MWVQCFSKSLVPGLSASPSASWLFTHIVRKLNCLSVLGSRKAELQWGSPCLCSIPEGKMLGLPCPFPTHVLMQGQCYASAAGQGLWCQRAPGTGIMH